MYACADRWQAKYRVWCVFCERTFVFEGVSKTTHSVQYSYVPIQQMRYFRLYMILYRCFVYVAIYFGLCACETVAQEKRAAQMPIIRFPMEFNQRWKIFIVQDRKTTKLENWCCWPCIFYFWKLNFFAFYFAEAKMTICISFSFQWVVYIYSTQLIRMEEKCGRFNQKANEHHWKSIQYSLTRKDENECVKSIKVRSVTPVAI